MPRLSSPEQPDDVGTAVASLLGGETVRVHEELRGVGQRREHRHAEPLHEALCIPLVPRRGEHDRRLALGRQHLDLARHAQRVEQQQAFVVVDRVGRNVLVPRLARAPVRMGCLPVPEAPLQLAHGRSYAAAPARSRVNGPRRTSSTHGYGRPVSDGIKQWGIRYRAHNGVLRWAVVVAPSQYGPRTGHRRCPSSSRLTAAAFGLGRTRISGGSFRVMAGSR